MTHTKGNWKIDETVDYTISVVSPWSDEVKPVDTRTFGDYRGAMICEMHYNSGVPTKRQAIANAKLIAAAPELLEALIEAKRMYEAIEPVGGWQGVYEQIIYAIKKATG